MSFKTIEWNIQDGIGYLVLNQPPANAMTLIFFEELDELIQKIKKTHYLKGIIITGQGRHFSSGADLTELTQSIIESSQSNPGDKYLDTPAFMKRNLDNFRYFNDLKIPVIAAITGVCIGSAFELALFCHFRLCALNVVLGLPESTFGLIPGLGGVQKLLENVNKTNTMAMVFRGNTFNAREAFKNGLVDLIIPKGQLTEAAETLIEIASVNYKNYNKNEYLHELGRNLSRMKEI